MKIKTSKQIEITLIDTDIKNFKKIIEKISDETSNKGFKKSIFTREESDLIHNIKDELT